MAVGKPNNSGCVYVVTTLGKVLQLAYGEWSELTNSNHDLRVKRISVCSTNSNSSIWAICGDHQVYLRLESEVPCRLKEESYENQRWNPKDGFCNKLLPTDRPFYSSDDGLADRELDGIALPSPAWVWDDQWHLEQIYNGQHLDPESWTYAIDFPRTFAPSKSWNSCVRRRKWIRHRRYNALQIWFQLPPVVLNDMVEPFIDISAGGQQLIGAMPGFMAVWAVTINGLLLYRKGVNLTSSPEGNSWVKIETPMGLEPCQVSVSPSGHVWILCWSGQILARSGVTWDCEMGTSWLEVSAPFNGVTFSHISVGSQAAWVVSRENEVWLRKGLDTTVIGSTWTSMIGAMNLVFTGSDNQVCGLLVQDQKLYLRTGIKPEEPGGRTWKMLPSDEETFTWIAFDGKGFVLRLEDTADSSWTEPWRGRILNQLRQRQRQWADTKYIEYNPAVESTDWVKSGRALYQNVWVNLNLCCSSQDSALLNVGDRRLPAVEITAVRVASERRLIIHSLLNPPFQLTFPSEEEVEDWAAHLTKVARASRNCTDVFSNSIWVLSSSGDPFVHEGSSNQVKDTVYEMEMISDAGNHSSLFIHDIPDGFYRDCRITIRGAVPNGAARFSVNLQCGIKILPHEVGKPPTARRDVALHINPRFDTSSSVEVVRNTLLNGIWDVEEKSGIFDLQPGSRFTLSIQCQRHQYLVNLNGDSFSFAHRLSPFSPSHIVVKGDVNVFSVTYSMPNKSVIPSHAFFTQTGGHFRHVEANSTGVAWAIGQDGSCWIHTGCHGGGFFKGIFGGSAHGIHPVTDESYVYVYENQRWNPVNGFSSRGLPTDRPPFSDVSGLIAYNKENMPLPNRHWTWTSEWLIDYHPPDGADRDGFQYATDYPTRFHAYKGSFDYVRRRRWMRKCRFNSTGPFFQFALTKLLDVSMQVDHSGALDEPVLLWAIAANGSILRRVGVTARQPEGKSWESVLSEHAFQSISVGSDRRVWAITSLGAPTLRHLISDENPDGAAWLLLDRPEGNPILKQISAGDTQVWVVDTNNRLYRRKDIVSILPEGTSWEFVAENVLHVSVGMNDQVWAVLDSVPPDSKIKEKGSVCIRRGITSSCPAGTGWEFVTGGGWQFICSRGYKAV